MVWLTCATSRCRRRRRRPAPPQPTCARSPRIPCPTRSSIATFTSVVDLPSTTFSSRYAGCGSRFSQLPGGCGPAEDHPAGFPTSSTTRVVSESTSESVASPSWPESFCATSGMPRSPPNSSSSPAAAGKDQGGREDQDERCSEHRYDSTRISRPRFGLPLGHPDSDPVGRTCPVVVDHDRRDV